MSLRGSSCIYIENGLKRACYADEKFVLCFVLLSFKRQAEQTHNALMTILSS